LKIKSNNIAKHSSWFTENPKKTGFILLALSLIIILLIVDRLILAIQPRQSNTQSEIVRAINLREHHPGLDKIIRPTEYYLAKTDNLKIQDYPFRIDNDGYILPHNNYDNPDHKIIFIGGSTTECMYVTEDNRFPYLAGQLIEERTKKQINSYNAGAAGNSSIHSLDILLNKIIPMNPDVVIIMHAINDYSILAYDHTYWPVDTPRSELITINDYFPKLPKETFLWHFKGLFKITYPNIYERIFILKENIIHPNIQKQTEPFDEWANRRHLIKERDFELMQKEYRWAIELLVTVCKGHGILPVLMTQANRFKDNPDDITLKSLEPMLSAGIDYKTFKLEYDRFNQISREVASSNNIPLIDLANLVPQENVYMYDTVHYNDNGSQFVAKIISDSLTEILSQL